MKCPYCKSKNTVQNGHAPSGKKRRKCNRCQRTFSITTSKKYPPTGVPFKFIAFILRTYNNVSLDKTTKFVNFWLKFFNTREVTIYKKKVSRSTVYNWKKQYGEIAHKLVSPKEVTLYFRNLIYQANPNMNDPPSEPPEPKDIRVVTVDVEKTIPGIETYTEFLGYLSNIMSKEGLNEMIQDEKMMKKVYKEIFKKPVTVKRKAEMVRYG